MMLGIHPEAVGGEFSPAVWCDWWLITAVLARLACEIDDSELLRASVIQPLPGGAMRFIAAYHIASDHLDSYSEVYNQFYWVENPRFVEMENDAPQGVAAFCATYRADVLISDLRDKDAQRKFCFIDPFPSQPDHQPEGGIFAVPLYGDDDKCIAIVSVTSEKCNYLADAHVARAKAFLTELYFPLLRFLRAIAANDMRTENKRAILPFLAHDRMTTHELPSQRTEPLQPHIEVETAQQESHIDQELQQGVVVELPPPIELPNGELNPEYIGWGFQKVAAEQEDTSAKWRPSSPPTRFGRIWDAFKRHNYQPATLDELAEPFTQAKDPLDAVQTTISLFNRVFVKLGVELELERFTSYRVRRRPSK